MFLLFCLLVCENIPAGDKELMDRGSVQFSDSGLGSRGLHGREGDAGTKRNGSCEMTEIRNTLDLSSGNISLGLAPLMSTPYISNLAASKVEFVLTLFVARY
jgi:hypothetical protein